MLAPQYEIRSIGLIVTLTTFIYNEVNRLYNWKYLFIHVGIVYYTDVYNQLYKRV